MKNTGMNTQLGIKWFVFYTKVRPWLAVLVGLATLVDFFRYIDVYITNWWLLLSFCATVAQVVLSIFVWIKSKGDYLDFVHFVKIALIFETITLPYQQIVQQYVKNDFEIVSLIISFAVCIVLAYLLWYQLNIKYFERRIITWTGSDIGDCSDDMSRSVESKDNICENKRYKLADAISKFVSFQKCRKDSSSIDVKNQYTHEIKSQKVIKAKKLGKFKIVLWALGLVALIAIIVFIIAVACGNDNTDNNGDSDTYSAMDYNKEDLSKYIKLGQYKGLSVVAPRQIVSESEIDERLQTMIDELTQYEAYEINVTDRATMAGDRVNISYVGTMDGEVFEGGSADSSSIVLTENNGYIDWFDDNLYGVMPGTTVTVTDKFPDDYYEGFSGREVTFEITVNYIAGHYTIPELTDEFISQRTDAKSVEEYREQLRGWIQEEHDAEYDAKKYQLMWTEVLENVTVIELPKEQVMYYYTSQRSAYELYAGQYGYTYEELISEMGFTDEYLMEWAEERVKDELVFYAIVKAEGLEVTTRDYTDGIIRYAEAQGMSESALVEEYGEEYIKECVLWDKMMYYIESQTTFVDAE